MYDFDKITGRHGTGCVKYDGLEGQFGRADLLPLWVADMDFETGAFIVDALRERIAHPVFGYPEVGPEYFRTIAGWVENLHGWKVDPEHFRFIPGIVRGFALLEHFLLGKGDKVVIQPPVYHPFRITAQEQGFGVVENPLVPIYGDDGFLETYKMDLGGLERICGDPAVKMLVLSNPHNPCGVAWDAGTLAAVADIAVANGVTVISDEIHCEMTLGGARHVPFASVSGNAAKCSVTFMAPTKTFNIAGIVSSYAIIEDPELRDRIFGWLDATEISYPGIFSITATMAAYTKGARWREEMLEYVQANVDFVDGWLRDNLPEIRAVRPQASFLIWLDCRKLGLPQEELNDLFVNKARLALNDGTMFGTGGEGFMRLNAGCPRSVLAEALRSLQKALKQ